MLVEQEQLLRRQLCEQKNKDGSANSFSHPLRMLTWGASQLRAAELELLYFELQCRLCNQLELEWMAKYSLKTTFLFSVSCIPAHRVVAITENLKLRAQGNHHLISFHSQQGRGQWWGWEPRDHGVGFLEIDWLFSVHFSQESALAIFWWYPVFTGRFSSSFYILYSEYVQETSSCIPS